MKVGVNDLLTPPASYEGGSKTSIDNASFKNVSI